MWLQANLAAILTKRSSVYGVETNKQLKSATVCFDLPYAQAITFLLPQLEPFLPPPTKRIFAADVLNSTSSEDWEDYCIERVRESASGAPVVFIRTEPDLSLLLDRLGCPSSVRLAPQVKVSVLNFAFFVDNNPILLEIINSALVQLWSNGMRADNEAKWLEVECSYATTKTTVISLHDMLGVFIIVGSISGFASVCASLKEALARAGFWEVVRQKDPDNVTESEIEELKIRLTEISKIASDLEHANMLIASDRNKGSESNILTIVAQDGGIREVASIFDLTASTREGQH